MSSRKGPYIPTEEYLETLNPGITRPQDDFLNKPKATNDNTPLAEGATYSNTAETYEETATQEASTQTPRQQQVHSEQPNRKISNASAAKMIAVALFFDLIGLIPLIGNITSTVGAGVVFGIWFLILGVSLISPKKVASWGISLVAEAIPALGSVVPGVTVGVGLVVAIDRIEEKTGLNITELAKGNVSDLASVGNNLKGQVIAKFTGATPAPTPANDTSSRISSVPTGATVNQAVPKRTQMVDNVSNKKAA